MYKDVFTCNWSEVRDSRLNIYTLTYEKFISIYRHLKNLSEYTVCTYMCSPVIGRKFVTHDSTYRARHMKNVSEYTVCKYMCSPVIGRKFVTRDSTYRARHVKNFSQSIET